MADSVDRVFAHALQTVRKIPRTGSARPPPEDRLRLYGLYKQSMEGDVHGVMERPEGAGDDSRAEREKWDAWNAQRGISKTEAKRRYVTTLIETMHKYASATPEARELVSELEFVWDQIKSNVPSSTMSSPLSPTHPGLPHHAYPPTDMVATTTTDTRLGAISPNPLDKFEQTPSSETNEDTTTAMGTTTAAAAGGAGTIPGEDPSSRKWRRRVERALAEMTTEVAALREQLEIRRAARRHGRVRSIGIWTVWIIWLVIKHIAIEAVFWGAVFLWMRRRGDRRAEEALRMVLGYVKDGLRGLGFRRINKYGVLGIEKLKLKGR